MTFLLVLWLSAPRAGAEDLAAKRQELIDVQKQLETKKREIDEARKEESVLEHDVSRLKDASSEARRRLEAMQERIRDAESKKSGLRSRLGALHLAEGSWRGVLADELRGYVASSDNDVSFYGARGVWEEEFRRQAILEKLHYLEGVRGSRKTTEAAEAEARRAAEALKVKGKGAKADSDTRHNEVLRAQQSLRETHGKVEHAQKSMRELQDSALALARLLRTLEKKSPYRIAGERIPLAEPKHSLPWPAEGKVVSTFGRHPVKEFGTVMINQGIRIATGAGAPVRPVKAGKVIFAGLFRSYGQVLIVDHGQAFYTIYGQLGELKSRKGEDVMPEEPMAAAGAPSPRPGEPAVESGGVVYFELRQSGEALDPLEWLQPAP